MGLLLPAISGGAVNKAAKKITEGFENVVDAIVNGKRNGKLAGSIHPKAGVPFDADSFPVFSDHLYKGGINDVTIKPTKNRNKDFEAANKAAGYSSTPDGYTWHHHQETGRMQLVETNVHQRTGHTGGFALW